jgi:hypothetical protein
MGRLILPRYTVIRDTREKEGYGWHFLPHNIERRPPNCNGTLVKPLKTGDYSIQGYEDIVSVERKEDFAELWSNYTTTRKRFEEEMERMSCIKHTYLLVESNLTSDHFELTPPQFSKGVPGKALIRWILWITAKHNVTFMPVGSSGRKVCQMILEEIVRIEKDRWVEKP